MKRLFALVVCMMLSEALVAADLHGVRETKITISPSVVTAAGQPRSFWGAQGRTMWSPSLPLYRGDRLRLVYSTSNGLEPSRVSVKLDGKSLADLKNAPWAVTIDTAGLPIGMHTAAANVRFTATPVIYGIAEFIFFVQEAPAEVKGMVQEIGTPPEGKGPSVVAPDSVAFTPPGTDNTDDSFTVVLRSQDPDVDALLRTGKPVSVSGPVVFRVQEGPGLDRWAYVVTRDGRQVVGAGPMRLSTYLELAPKGSGDAGLLPGNVTLRVWGVRVTGIYSGPVEVPLTITEKE